MMLDFTDANGNIFNILGRLGKMILNARDYQAAQLTAMTSLSDGYVGQLENEPDIQAVIGSQYISLLNSSAVATNGSVCQAAAADALNRKVFRDKQQFNQTLTQQNLLSSIAYLITQMQDQGQSVLKMTVTGAAQAAGAPNGPHFIGTGTGIINISVTRPSDGRDCENSLAESILFLCNSDSYLNNAVRGNEGFSITGQGQVGSVFDFDWPMGSDCSISLNAIDGNSDNSSGNILTNSGFEDWTNDVPDNWDVESGGDLISKQGSIVYDGSYSLQITGDGSTEVEIQQIFGDSDGTIGTLSPLSTYSFCVFMRSGGTTPTTGTVVWDLVDANGVVIQDAGGTNMTFSTDLSSLTTGFLHYTFNFRTPYVLPSSIYLRMRTTPEDGVLVFIDKASLGVFNRLYGYGPYAAIHAGNIPFRSGDYGYANITNSRGSGGSLNTWQTLFFQLFNGLVIQNDILLPSSSSPTISDALITR